MLFHTSPTYHSDKIQYTEQQQVSIQRPILSKLLSYYSGSFVSFFFPTISIFFQDKMNTNRQTYEICLKAIIMSKCKRTLLFDDSLLLGSQRIWQKLENLSCIFFLCDSAFCVFLCQGKMHGCLSLRASIQANCPSLSCSSFLVQSRNLTH